MTIPPYDPNKPVSPLPPHPYQHAPYQSFGEKYGGHDWCANTACQKCNDRFKQETRQDRRSRSGFTLVELLVVIAIVLVLAAIGAGVVMQGIGWVHRTQTEITLRKLHERMGGRYETILREVRDWPTPVALLRQAGGSGKRAEVLKLKYLARWAMPTSYAEVTAFLAESQALGYAPSGYPLLVALRARLGPSGPATPAEQSAAILAALHGLLPHVSADDLALHETDMRLGVPMVVDAWGQPIVLVRSGPPSAYVSFLPGEWDRDDPENLLADDPAATDDWWDMEGAWFTATFGFNPNTQGTVGFGLLSGGPDGSLATDDDNLDTWRMRLRIGGQQ